MTSWPRLLLVAGLVLGGCRARPAEDPGAIAQAAGGNAIVIAGAELGSNVLDGLRHRIPAMQVSYVSGNCPAIVFRGSRSMRSQGDPLIYVDGTQVQGTCVLTQLSPRDVEYIEVYPSGNIARAGVRRSPFGVILVQRVRQIR